MVDDVTVPPPTSQRAGSAPAAYSSVGSARRTEQVSAAARHARGERVVGTCHGPTRDKDVGGAAVERRDSQQPRAPRGAEGHFCSMRRDAEGEGAGEPERRVDQRERCLALADCVAREADDVPGLQAEHVQHNFPPRCLDPRVAQPHEVEQQGTLVSRHETQHAGSRGGRARAFAIELGNEARYDEEEVDGDKGSCQQRSKEPSCCEGL
eukprot:7378053-Prymnesium_polylepis.1